MSRGLELLIAQTILQGFDAQYGRFLEGLLSSIFFVVEKHAQKSYIFLRLL